MTAIEPLLRQPAAQAIAWALLQFVWQGALIGVLTAGALAALKRSAADVRYVVSTISLCLMLTMPIVTGLQSWRSASMPPEPPAVGTSLTGAADTPLATSDARGAGAASAAPPAGRAIDRAAIVDAGALDKIDVEAWLPMLLLVWLSGVSLLTLRLMSGWLWIQRLKTYGVPANESWQRMAARLCRRLHITRAVRLLESSLVEVPTVIGWMKPVILLPGSVLAGLSPQQLEAILAHELAHIRRHDYLVNLMQTLVETLLFYHPAVWWVSRRIRVERENCCDDLAVSLCGDPYTYARALADLEERRGTCGHLAMAATGGSLLQRVRRLLGAPTSHAGRGPGWLAGSAALVLMGGIVAGALGSDIMRAQQAASTPEPAVVPVVPAVTTVPEPMRATTPARAVRVPAAAVATTTPQEATKPAVDVTPAIAATIAVLEKEAAAAVTAAVEMESTLAKARAAITTAAADAVVPTAPVLSTSQESSGNFTWSHNGEKLQVRYHGEIEFAEDDSDVKRLSPNGYLKMQDGGWIAGRTVEFRADSAGNITRRYWYGMAERPFEPEGRKWLAQALPRFIRQTGIGAHARVGRMLNGGGTSAVLAEISRIEGSWAKRVYFKELLRQAKVDAQTARQILTQAGREISSDFELASLLIDSGDQLLLDDASRKAYFEAARSIQSDFEMRRVHSAALKRGTVSSPILASILDASRSVDSDFELASLLVQVAKLQPLDQTTRGPFFAALATVDSDFEHRRVLATLASRTDLTPEVVTAMVDSAITLQSDFELASLLTQIVKQHGVEGALRAPFFRAVESIDSAFERARVLQTLARRPDVSAETVVAILRAVPGVKSNHEASQVLLTVASAHPISGSARDLYIEAAEKLGDFEQGRVLTALVKNERRR